MTSPIGLPPRSGLPIREPGSEWLYEANPSCTWAEHFWLEGSVQESFGAPWYDFPLPPLRHKCYEITHSSGSALASPRCLSRCACGAWRYQHGRWNQVNSARRRS